MPTINQLFRLVNEMAFVLVGALLLWVGVFDRYLFNPRHPAWLVLTVALILWGLRTWLHAPRIAVRRERVAMRIGGASLAVTGTILLSLAWSPFRWAGLLLAVAGGIFVVRGLVTAAIMRQSS
jgi:hypothetical protein